MKQANSSWLARWIQWALNLGFMYAYKRVKIDPYKYLLYLRRGHGLPVNSLHQVLRASFIFAAGLLFVTSPALGQQKYVTRYDLFAGYAFLDSPAVGLFENGFQFQIGARPATWISVGFDYSISAGNLTLTPNLLTTTLQQQLGAQLEELIKEGVIPPTYTLSVPSHSRTQTLAAGPQLAYRHFSKVTLFIRPDFGAIYEVANLRPTDAVSQAIVAELAPSGRKTDWTAFYGFGGGTDLIFSKHVALRVQADLVYDHLFSDLLQNGRWTVRFGVGPCFNFGKNIVK
jgi:hypothetical protein